MIKASASWNEAAIARVKTRLHGVADRFDKKATIEIGVGGEDADKPALHYDGSSGDATLGQVARWLEFGTSRMPERRWLRGWFDMRAEALRAGLVNAVRRHYLLSWAQTIGGELRELVRAGVGDLYAPLAQSTKAARERAGLRIEPTLYAVGQFVDAIKVRIDGQAADGKHFTWSNSGGP